MGSIIGCEVNIVVENSHGVEILQATASNVNVFDHHCPGGRSVTLPQLGSVRSVVGCEIYMISKHVEVVA